MQQQETPRNIYKEIIRSVYPFPTDHQAGTYLVNDSFRRLVLREREVSDAHEPILSSCIVRNALEAVSHQETSPSHSPLRKSNARIREG